MTEKDREKEYRDRLFDTLKWAAQNRNQWMFTIVTLVSAIIGGVAKGLIQPKAQLEHFLTNVVIAICVFNILFTLLRYKQRTEREYNGTAAQIKQRSGVPLNELEEKSLKSDKNGIDYTCDIIWVLLALAMLLMIALYLLIPII